MKYTWIIFLLALLINSCKKDETWQHWDNLAQKKYEEIITLASNYSCTDTPELTYQTINNKYCNEYILIHNNDLKKFEDLNRQYQEYRMKAYDSGMQLLAINCYTPPPVRIACKENKAYILNANNMTLQDLEIEIPKQYQEIKNYYNSRPCTSLADWLGLVLIHEETLEPIAIKKADRNLMEKISLYNNMIERKMQFENKTRSYTDVKVSLSCENNSIKASIEK